MILLEHILINVTKIHNSARIYTQCDFSIMDSACLLSSTIKQQIGSGQPTAVAVGTYPLQNCEYYNCVTVNTANYSKLKTTR